MFGIGVGDFNKANLKKHMPKFHQQVSCPTRGDRTLDHLYCPVKNAYKSIQRPHLGNSDQLMVHLIPKYKQKLKVSKPVSRTIHQWTESAVEKLQGCFFCTDWDVFKEDSDLDRYAEATGDYMTFCRDLCIPTKTVV